MPLGLVWRNLLAHRVRSALTMLSVVIAVFLVCTLRSLVVALAAGVDASAQNRLVVQSAVSLFVSLPLAYQGKIEQVDGVAQTCKLQWFGGIYQEPKNFFAQFAVDHDRLLEAYPEIELVEGTRAAFEGNRSGCLIGRGLAEKYGFRVGDRVPLIGTIFPLVDGSAWDLEVTGIYRSKASNVDENTLWFHFALLQEAMESGRCAMPPSVGVYVVRLAPGADPTGVMRRIDELFENGPQRVQSTTEAEFQRQFVSMLGGVPTLLSSIGGGVIFAIFLATLNTMLMAGRERTRDLGIMKALGFGDGVAFGLLMAESCLLCLGGGVLGLGLAKGAEAALAVGLQMIVPFYVVGPETLGLGLAMSLALGVLAGLAPAWRASRLEVVQALRAEG